MKAAGICLSIRANKLKFRQEFKLKLFLDPAIPTLLFNTEYPLSFGDVLDKSIRGTHVAAKDR